jgi:hypothetical protein
MSDALRKLAAELRQESARRQNEKRVKCAQIITAATGLDLLRRKLGGRDA